jgi:hypothetical protein
MVDGSGHISEAINGALTKSLHPDRNSCKESSIYFYLTLCMHPPPIN